MYFAKKYIFTVLVGVSILQEVKSYGMPQLIRSLFHLEPSWSPADAADSSTDSVLKSDRALPVMVYGNEAQYQQFPVLDVQDNEFEVEDDAQDRYFLETLGSSVLAVLSVPKMLAVGLMGVAFVPLAVWAYLSQRLPRFYLNKGEAGGPELAGLGIGNGLFMKDRYTTVYQTEYVPVPYTDTVTVGLLTYTACTSVRTVSVGTVTACTASSTSTATRCTSTVSQCTATTIASTTVPVTCCGCRSNSNNGQGNGGNSCNCNGVPTCSARKRKQYSDIEEKKGQNVTVIQPTKAMNEFWHENLQTALN